MKIVRVVLGTFVATGIFISLAFAGMTMFVFSGKYTPPIIMYHYITETDHQPEDVTLENFRNQMKYLKKHHYDVLRMDELVDKVQSGQPLSPKSVVIAFDDGAETNYTVAMPILKEFNFPAIFFVSPGFFDRPGFMTLAQVKALQEAGFEIGSHGMSQAYLPDLPEDQLDYEILQSKRILENELGTRVNYLAYPIGGFTDNIKSLAKKAGYKAAFTTNRGYDRFDKDLYEINRIRFGNADNKDIILFVKLSGYYNRFRDLKNPY